MLKDEVALAGVAGALVAADACLTRAENRLLAKSSRQDSELVERTRLDILKGEDPLGQAFSKLRSAKDRRDLGATFTPPQIVQVMVNWSTEQGQDPIRIVDPGTGSGRFLSAAAQAFPKADLIAVEVDPLCRLMLRANAQVLKYSDRLEVRHGDYRSARLPRVDGPTLFIGNPPYVRHHNISPKWKDWFAAQARKLGIPASKLSGLHIHFFLKTALLARPGDFGIFITASEWIDVNYGAFLRDLLADKLGGTSLHVINPDALPFDDAMTTGSITSFRVGEKRDTMQVARVCNEAGLPDLSAGTQVSWDVLRSAPRWSPVISGLGQEKNPDEIELGELFRVHRGQVTGANKVWIAGQAAVELPNDYLFPTVTKARDLLSAGDRLSDASKLRKVIDLPKNLDDISHGDRPAVERYLAWAESQQAHAGYVARNRRSWWSVGLKDPAPILCTYMARRAPAFVENACGARHINVAHGLYPQEPFAPSLLRAYLRYLSCSVSVSDGRVYAGGLTKFEPREVERIRVPRPETLMADPAYQ
ncbi:MAG: class I SAM-dependent methyltransferase [Rhodobacteraceae bacterium]|nr:class I SAM-dependent methyltransferase [Paracoccaceae bacterium]